MLNLSRALIFVMAMIASVVDAPRAASADSLDDILSSPILTGSDSDETALIRSDDKRFFVGRSNLWKLFQEKENDKGALFILDWLGEISTSEFKLVEKKTQIERSHVALHLTYSIPHDSQVAMDILVPHPLHRQQVELGLIKDFADLEPPKLSVSSFEQIIIHTHPGKLYVHKDGKCSLLFKLFEGTRVNLRADGCDFAKYLTDIAEQSDLNRLNYKLEN